MTVKWSQVVAHLFILAGFIGLGARHGTASEPVPTAAQVRFFESDVRPVLAQNCYKCHGPSKQKSKLRLDSRAAAVAGGESGPAIVPGKPDESLLVEAINHDDLEMPPDQRLKDDQIAALTKWVEMGAPWPADSATRSLSKITEADRAWWSFQPLRRPEVPEVEDNGWCQNEIDQFIFRRLSTEGLKPAPPANPRVLARRIYFDLIGLPPTPEEIQQFESESIRNRGTRVSGSSAIRNLVARLLDSPHYGERWARHWLDLVRYAESDGFKQDAFRPHAWRYRDYVIRALNEDKPYDRFVMEQLAGDEIAPNDADAIVATAYLRHWIYEYNQRDVRTQWSNILHDVTDVTGEVFLGMGMGCARCHDHKFDPILRRDYYRLQAFFTPLLPRDDLPLGDGARLTEYREELTAWEAATADIRREIEKIERPHRERVARGAIEKFPRDVRPMLRRPVAERAPLDLQISDLAFRQVRGEYDKLDMKKRLKGDQLKRWEELSGQLTEFDKLKPQPLPPAFTVTDVGPVAPPTRIPGVGGDEEIAPGFLTVLDASDAPVETPPAAPNSTGRRSALARWITRPDNPLSTRVIVNRIWQYHFGRGLVATSSDFGRLGQPPSHPDLLDWLATEFVRRGWSIKEMHRLIMSSATYQQSALCAVPAAAQTRDPDNRLWWRMNSRRLDAEQIRDAMLAVSGELDRKAGGPSADWSQPRRTIYTKVIRNRRDPLLHVFDAPDNFNSTPERNTTTTPTQSLLMINGKWTLARAQALAGRLQKMKLETAEETVDAAYDLAYGRKPGDDERSAAVAFLESDESKMATPLVDFCHVLLNSNEFLYVD